MKIVKNPDGSLSQAAMMQTALSKERRELKIAKQEAVASAAAAEMDDENEAMRPDDPFAVRNLADAAGSFGSKSRYVGYFIFITFSVPRRHFLEAFRPPARGGGHLDGRAHPVRHVHAKDLAGAKCVALGEGTVNVAGCIRVLKQHGYAGVLSLETEGDLAAEPAQRLIELSRAYLKGGVGVLDQMIPRL